MNLGANLFKKNNLRAPGIITVKQNNSTHIAIKKTAKKNIQPKAMPMILFLINYLRCKSKKIY